MGFGARFLGLGLALVVVLPAVAEPPEPPRRTPPARKAPLARKAPPARKTLAKARPNAGAMATWKRLLAAFRAKGLASVRTGLRPVRLPAMGRLVPICDLVRKSIDARRRGQALPGDPLTKYEALCPPGAARPTARIAEDISGSPDNTAMFERGYKGLLLAELPDYVRYVGERVFALKGNATSAAEAAELFYQYGCRRISRLMPGFAKIEQKTIPAGVDLAGNWDAEFDVSTLTPPKKKAGSGGKESEEFKPPQKPEVVEVCAVTHAQLDATLKADLAIVAQSALPNARTAKGEDSLRPISLGVARNLPPPRVILEPNADRPGQDYASYDLPAKSLGNVLIGGLVTLAATVGKCMDACKKEPRCRAYSYLPGAQSGAIGQCKLLAGPGTKRSSPRGVSGVRRGGVGSAVTMDARSERLGATLRTLPIPAFVNPQDRAAIARVRPEECADLCRKDERCRAFTFVRPGVQGERARCYLKGEGTTRTANAGCCTSGVKEGNRDEFKDLGSYNPALTGETFNDISKRLLTFYRKTGSTRNFIAAMAQSGPLVGRLGSNAPPQARNEVSAQTTPGAVETRNRRAKLRRQVEQWTYGYEYEQLSAALGRANVSPQLKRDYQLTEARAVNEFWASPDELLAICQEPRTLQERVSCQKFAIEVSRSHCLEGRERDGTCKGGEVDVFLNVREAGSRGGMFAAMAAQMKAAAGQLSTHGRHTFFNWVVMKLLQEAQMGSIYKGRVVSDRNRFVPFIVRNLVDRVFLADKVDEKERKTQDGKRFLDSLPVTSWQRCYLWNPYLGQAGFQNICDQQDASGMAKLKAKIEADKASRIAIPWHQSMLFRMVLQDPSVGQQLAQMNQEWIKTCAQKKQVPKDAGEWLGHVFSFGAFHGTGKADAVPCDDLAREAEDLANQSLRANSDQMAMGRDDGLQKAGDSIGGVLGPIVGKLLGMLLQASGMYETMKTLARAAGLTPEQSVDCEDEEYRHDVMKIAACPKGTNPLVCQDTKRGCLLKIFAKNFTNVLESIIVMLGEKLVDWGVDLLRTALQAVKSALLAAAGSVPFAGGFLATLVDIGWELLMNYGAKMLLKSFVVAKLPEWLKIKELAKLPETELMNHPIVAAVMGIIIELLESAVTYGDKGWMAVGADGVLNLIQALLAQPRDASGKADPKKAPEYFWLRALTFAKKELREQQSGTQDDLGRQIANVARAMIGGFGKTIEARLEGSVLESFRRAVQEIKDLIDPSRLGDLVTRITSNPIGFLTEFIGKKLGPIVMPIITSLVPMEPWAKEMLNKLGAGVSDILGKLGSSQRVEVKDVVRDIVAAADPVVTMLLDKLPIADPALKKLVGDAYAGLSSALKDIDRIPALLGRPWDIVKGLADLTGDFLKSKVGDLVADPALGPEKTLLQGALDTILTVLSDASARERLFPGGSPSASAILARVGELLRPWAPARLRALLAGTGLEELAASAADTLFGPDGPFARGAAFFTGLGATLQSQGGAIVGRVVQALASIAQQQAERLGVGPMIGGLVRGVLGALGRVLTAPGGVATFLRQGAASVLGLVKEAFAPLLAELANVGGEALRPLTSLARDVVSGVLDVFANPTTLSQLAERGAAALGDLARRLATSLQTGLKSLLGRALPDAELRPLADAAVDGLFGLLSDPAQLARFNGERVVDLLKEIGGRLFGYARTKLMSALAQLPGLAAGTPAQGFVTAAVDALARLLAEPSRLRALVEGGASGLIGFVAQTFTPPLQALVGSLVPESVRAVAADVVTKVLGLLANPSELAAFGRATADSLIQKLAPLAKTFLEGALRSLVPGDAWARVNEALTAIQTALANPAALAQQAATAARDAIDNVIAAALVRIPDAGLRELSTGLVAVVRELVTGEGAGAQLRTQLGTLADRLVDLGGRYLSTLLPAGLAQGLGRAALDGLRSLLRGGDVAAALAQQAQSLIPGAVRALGGLLREGLASALPDRAIGGFVQGLMDEILGFVADPARWRELRERGVGAVLARVIPLVRDFATSMVGRLGGGAEALRPVLEGILGAAARLFSSPEAVAGLAQNAVGALVSLAVESVGPALVDLVERSTGSGAVAGFLRSALGSLGQILAQPSRLQSLLRGAAQSALTTLLGEARGLVERLLADVIKDEGLRGLAQEGLRAVLELVPQLAQGGTNVGTAVQQLIGRLLTPAAALAKTKLLALFPFQLSDLRDVVGRAFDRLVQTATGLVTQGQAAWSTLTSGASQLLGDAVQAVLPLLKGPILRAVSYPPLQGLLTRLLDSVANLLKDPAGLLRAFRDARTAMRTLLPELGKILGPFLDEVLVQPMPDGIPKDVVAKLVEVGKGFLDRPDTLDAFIQRVRGDYRGLLRGMVTDFKPALLRSVPSEALKTIFSAGIDMLLDRALGAGAASH